MSVLYLVRHGQASFGQENYDQLSERGIRQSRILAEYLMNAGLSFDALYAGEMSRQIDTAAEVIARYRKAGARPPEMQIVREFNEYNSKSILLSHVHELAQEDPALQADLENIYTDKKAFQRVFEKIMMRWVSGQVQKQGIPTWKDFNSRVQAGIGHIMASTGRGKTVIIFTSGGPISATMQMALGLSDEKALRVAWQIINTSVTKFLFDERRISLAAFNSTAHLDLLGEPDLVTYR
jgi:broad specificity phosphatase PhoE